MSTPKPNLTRRDFLGGTAALAASAITSGALSTRLGAQVPQPASTPTPSRETLVPTGTLDEAYWWNVRSHFEIADGLTYLNNGTLGPVPLHVQDVCARVTKEVAQNPVDNARTEDVERVRAALAGFVGAGAHEISFTRSTTEGMNLFAHGLDWREGDEVLMNQHEYASAAAPYRALEQRKGIKIVWVDFPSPPESVDQLVSLYEQAITPRTRVIMVSHISYVTGTRLPIKEITAMAHSRDVLVSVDGAQTFGMIDLDLHDLGCDHYAAGGQKWFLAGTGTGFNYIRADVQPQVWPLMGGADPRENAFGPLIYESYGQRDLPAVLAMEAAVDFHTAIGKPTIEARGRALGSQLRQGLAEIPGVTLWTNDDPALSCGLTTFSVGDLPMLSVASGIHAYNGVYLRIMERGELNAVRASTAFYNLPHELEMLLDAVRYVAQTAAA